jgi:hypothetical protein
MRSFDSILTNESGLNIERDESLVSLDENISKPDIFFSILFLSGLYTGVFLYISDNLFIPYFICGLSAIYFLIRNAHRLSFYCFMPLIYLYLITAVGMVFAPAPFEFFFERFKGFIQIMYSSSIGLLFFIHMRRWNNTAVSRLFMGFLIIIVAGATLEVFTKFKYLSDEFRHMVFRWGLYEADLRDLYTYGQIRPKLFTSEPSHVAKFYVLSLFVWFALSENKKRYVLYLFFISAGLVLIRSPIIILSIPLALAVEIFFRNRPVLNTILSRYSPLNRGNILILSVIFIFFLSIGLNTILSGRVQKIIIGPDESFALRVVGPALIAIDTIKEYPLWGTGITGKEAASEIIFDAYWRIGYRINRVYDANINFLSLFISYYGLLGGLLFIGGFIFLVGRLEIKGGMFIALTILLFSQTMGAFVGLRTWGYIFIILLVASCYRPVNE